MLGFAVQAKENPQSKVCVLRGFVGAFLRAVLGILNFY